MSDRFTTNTLLGISAQAFTSGGVILDHDQASVFLHQLCEDGEIDEERIAIAADLVRNAPVDTTTTHARLVVDSYVLVARKMLAKEPPPKAEAIEDEFGFGKNLPVRPTKADYVVCFKADEAMLRENGTWAVQRARAARRMGMAMQLLVLNTALERYVGFEHDLLALAKAYEATHINEQEVREVANEDFARASTALLDAVKRGKIQHDDPWGEFRTWLDKNYQLKRTPPRRYPWQVFRMTAEELAKDPWSAFKPDGTVA
jgi:hypothetical protein